METLTELRKGEKLYMARALASIEQQGDSDAVCALLDEAHQSPKAHVVGFTGPPGVGKSTLVNELISLWREQGKTVGVIAVDPSSRKTGGALLGDRTRMTTDPTDSGVFIRSLASRGTLGGLTELAYPAMTLMRAVYDRVIVETVGVGQSEADISTVADTVVLCVQPGSGDSLQFMKAGIMEIPDIAVVTKADFGKPAERALGEMQGALSLALVAPDAWKVPVQAVSSSAGTGLPELVDVIDSHFEWLTVQNKLADIRLNQAKHWLKTAISSRYGAEGLALAQKNILTDAAASQPFSQEQLLIKSLTLSITPK